MVLGGKVFRTILFNDVLRSEAFCVAWLRGEVFYVVWFGSAEIDV